MEESLIYKINNILKNKLFVRIGDNNIDTKKIINYLYENNNNDIFNQKIYDILIALDIEENNDIITIMNECNLEYINKCNANDLCKCVNADILNNINKRNKESVYEEVYNTEFKCSKCQESKTSTEYVNKHLKMDESSSLKVTCLVCNNKWYI